MHKLKWLVVLGIALFLIGVVGIFYTKESGKIKIDEAINLQQKSFDHIILETDAGRVNITATKGKKPEVRLKGTKSSYDKHVFSAKVQNKTLKIILNEKQKKLFNIDIFQKALDLQVTVPDKQYRNLQVNGENGKVQIGGIHADNVNISSDNGQLILNKMETAKLRGKANNGRITAKDIQAEKIDLKSDNGRINIQHAMATLTDVEANNGTVDLRHVGGEIIANTNNGKVFVATNRIDQPMTLHSNNGSITVKTKQKPKNALFDAQSHNGRISIYGTKKNTNLFGKGENIIKLTGHNGKITVE